MALNFPADFCDGGGMSQNADRAFYQAPSPTSDVARHAAVVAGTADTVPDATAVTSNVILHRATAQAGFAATAVTLGRRAGALGGRVLDQMLVISPASLRDPRAPDQRMIGNCHHAALLTCALLRSHGVAVRARAGSAPYLSHGEYVDHWICELLTPGGWQRFDPDAGLSPGDATAATFLTGGEAWLRCRASEADPELFGIDRWRGWWFIRNNVIRDFAALCKLELLPWDRWGAMTGSEQDSFIDEIARLGGDDSAVTNGSGVSGTTPG
jgi:hypothetical protein